MLVVQELEPQVERERRRDVQPAIRYPQRQRDRARFTIVHGRRAALRRPETAPRSAHVRPAQFEYLHLSADALAQVQIAQSKLLEN